MKQNEQGKL